MWLNQFKTVLLLGIMSALFLLLGRLIGGTQGLQVALILAIVMNFLLYFFSDRLVLRLYNAQPLDEKTYGWIYTIVHELTQSMHLPMPKLWLINTPMANAFATGRSPSHASVAVTSGIISILDRDELRGVIAHELGHVKNRDMLVATIAATMATAIGYIAHMLQYAAFWTSSSDRKKEGGNPIVMLLVAIIMPIAASLIQLAISRSREYLADETGARYSREPLALANALEKLQNHIPQSHLNSADTTHASTASLFIVNPFTTDGWIEWFSTHPPAHKRIERLRELSRTL